MERHSPFPPDLLLPIVTYRYLLQATISKIKKQRSFTCYHSKEHNVGDMLKEQMLQDSRAMEHTVPCNVY